VSIDQALLGWGKAVEQRLRHALMPQQLAHLHTEKWLPQSSWWHRQKFAACKLSGLA
jgi:hypothetical protein